MADPNPKPQAPKAAKPLKNVPFNDGDPAKNRTLRLVHPQHGEATVGAWQVEEFAARGWTAKE